MALVPVMGCSVKSDCEKAVDHIILVVGLDPAVTDKQKAGLYTVKTRKIFLEQCYAASRPAEGIQCVFASTTLKEINACQKKMTDQEPTK